MTKELEIPENIAYLKKEGSTELQGSRSSVDQDKQLRLHIAITIVSDPINTFYFEAHDDQMRYFGIRRGSIIIVNKSVEITSGVLVVCSVDGEWLTRKLQVKESETFLCINDGMDASINITGKAIKIFGAVTWTCLPHSRQLNGRLT